MNTKLVAYTLFIVASCHYGISVGLDNSLITTINLEKLEKQITIIQQRNTDGKCSKVTSTPVANPFYINVWTAQRGRYGNETSTIYVNDKSDYVKQTGEPVGESLKLQRYNKVIKIIDISNSSIKYMGCGYIEEEGKPDAKEQTDLQSFCNEDVLKDIDPTQCSY